MSELTLLPIESVSFENHPCPTEDTLSDRIYGALRSNFLYLSSGAYKSSFSAKELSPEKQESCSVWLERVLHILNIKKGGSYYHYLIPLELRAEESSYYLALQKKIAKLIPNEQNRPTFEAIFKVGKLAKVLTPSLAILGGVGPISDATFIDHLLDDPSLKELPERNIHLLSIPAPRLSWENNYIHHLYLYAARIIHFTEKHPIGKLLIASNTAHIHAHFIQITKARHVFQSLIETVVNSLPQDPKTLVLPLGTNKSYHYKLYPNALAQKGIASITLDSKEQKKLQELIDRIKVGEENLQKEAFELIFNFVNMYEMKPSHLILGCTEIPIALGDSGIEKLENSLKCKVINTEDVLIQIAHDFLKSAQD